MNDMRRVHAEQLVSSLELSLPPVAIAFCDVVPDDVPMFEGVVPAGCAFWSQATSRTFATAARDHALCAIGIHTHNLSGAAASQPEELHASLKAMMGLDYLREEEIPAIPVMPRPLAHALYGPLADFPIQPEVVLVFAHAQHGLVLRGLKDDAQVSDLLRVYLENKREGPVEDDHLPFRARRGHCTQRGFRWPGRFSVEPYKRALQLRC